MRFSRVPVAAAMAEAPCESLRGACARVCGCTEVALVGPLGAWLPWPVWAITPNWCAAFATQEKVLEPTTEHSRYLSVESSVVRWTLASTVPWGRRVWFFALLLLVISGAGDLSLWQWCVARRD